MPLGLERKKWNLLCIVDHKEQTKCEFIMLARYAENTKAIIHSLIQTKFGFAIFFLAGKHEPVSCVFFYPADLQKLAIMLRCVIHVYLDKNLL